MRPIFLLLAICLFTACEKKSKQKVIEPPRSAKYMAEIGGTYQFWHYTENYMGDSVSYNDTTFTITVVDDTTLSVLGHTMYYVDDYFRKFVISPSADTNAVVFKAVDHRGYVFGRMLFYYYKQNYRAL